MEEFIKNALRDIYDRFDKITRNSNIEKIKIPSTGYFVADTQTADPAVENGRIYYNSTTHKMRKCENGAWADM